MIGFDFEVYRYDWLVVFENFITDQKTVIINDEVKLKEFYEKNKNELFIGFNNNNYDNFIFKGIMLDKDPYYLSNVIINKTNSIWRLGKWNTIPLNSYDVSYNVGFTSLKENEAYMGISIDETPIPFDLDRPLTKSEIEKVVTYCERDVNATKKIFFKTNATFETRLNLVSTYNLDGSFLNKSNNAILDEVLGAKRKYYSNDEYDPFDFSQLNLKIDKYNDVVEYYKQPIPPNYKGFGYSTMVAGVPHTFGIGGIHGAVSNFWHKGELWLIDVESYYPSLMIKYGWFSRSIPEHKQLEYARIKEERVLIKHTDPKLSETYKLVLNTAYGSYKYKWCNLYDPRMANNITIGGQILLLDLIEQLEPYITLVQSNTDGIIVIPHDKDKVREIVIEWEKRSGMKTSIEIGTRIAQKDVNNYVMEMDDGSITTVGGYVNQYNPRGLRRTMSVVDKALVEHIIHDVPIREYIENNNDPLDYMLVSKVGKTYDRVFLQTENEIIDTNFVNRSFAGFKKGTLYKQKIGKNPERVANHSDRTFIWNGYVDDLDISLIDKEWYIAMANNRLSDYKGEKRK